MLAGPRSMDRTNNQREAALRCIPSLEAFTRREALAGTPRRLVLKSSRTFLEQVRRKVLAGEMGEDKVASLFDSGAADAQVLDRCVQSQTTRHRRVINATGVVLHTGLGRAPLAESARDALREATGYAIVEVDPATGARDQRELKVAELLCDVTGATQLFSVPAIKICPAT